MPDSPCKQDSLTAGRAFSGSFLCGKGAFYVYGIFKPCADRGLECTDPCSYIFLKVPIEELIIIEVIYAFAEDAEHGRIILGAHVRHLEGASFGVDISAGKPGYLGSDVSVIVGEAGSGIEAFICGSAVGLPVERIYA